MIGTGTTKITPRDARQPLRRWIAANAISEFLGLWLTFLIVELIFARLGGPESAGLILASFLIAVAAGQLKPPSWAWLNGGPCIPGSQI